MSEVISAVSLAIKEVLEIILGTGEKDITVEVCKVLAEQEQPLTPWSVE